MIKPVSGFKVGKPTLVVYIRITDLLQFLKTERERDKKTKREKETVRAREKGHQNQAISLWKLVL